VLNFPHKPLCTATTKNLRAILVPEFAHYFYLSEQIVLRADAGERSFSFSNENLYEDEEADGAHLPNLTDWFDERDVAHFAYWDDARLTAIEQNIYRLGKMKRVDPE
jgi:hypothetical protein